MAKKNYNSDGQSATDKALDKFTELMIEKIENLQGDWKKPWFTPGVAQPPKNLSGRHYNGGNALMLMMQAEKMGYESPVWGTFDRIIGLNYSKDKDGRKSQLVDKEGNALPSVSVNKGEKSFPVFLTTFTVVNPDTKEKIPYDDYRQLPREEQAKYNVYPKLNVYNVFNVAAQTNIKDARPELYEKIMAEAKGQVEHQEGDLKSHPVIDKMIDDNLFYCPIKQIKGDEAYYSISKDEIVIPTREQFIDGEAFASNTLHECAHATGAESRLDRLKPTAFGSEEYAREELTAELSAAVVASQYGLTKHVKNDSAAYLKNWLSSLQQSPDFLKTVLNDVKKASSLINQRLEAIQLEMDKGEKADFSQFRQNTSDVKSVGQNQQEETEKQAAKEVIQENHYHRSR
ncbi:MAG: zincin-like metallopeptidase domain-containing protein [Bacteroidales bacterium]|nr:zincin-like metallopeptidase domain-containing protein [Bacteroidales bacterium]